MCHKLIIFRERESTMYSVKYEKTLPPWYSGIEKIEAETSEDAVKEFYKRHNSFEERIREVNKMQAPTKQK